MAGVIVLAAGASTRLGEPKQLVCLGGELLVDRAVRVASEAGLAPIVVVLGAHAEQIQRQWASRVEEVIVNPDWGEGMGSSIRAGVAVLRSRVTFLVVMTCDQPAVTPEHLRRLVERCHEAPVASSYGGRRGVPACFPAGSFSQLELLEGDQGARAFLLDAAAVDLPGGALDIDSPAALDRARAVYG